MDNGWRRNVRHTRHGSIGSVDEAISLNVRPRSPSPVRARGDMLVLRRHEWAWAGAVLPYVTYAFTVEPNGQSRFDCHLRYSDLFAIEAHGTVRQARAEGHRALPTPPSAHSVPVVGKLFDTRRTAQDRGLAIQLYLHALLAAGGGVRATVLDLMRDRADQPIDPVEEEV
jgi:hypothetical protein